MAATTRWVLWIRLGFRWQGWQATFYYDSESETTADEACRGALANKRSGPWVGDIDGELILLPANEYPDGRMKWT